MESMSGFAIRAALLVAVVGCGHDQKLPAPQRGAFHDELVAVPVQSARAWTSALAPNKRGSWNFITQIYERDSNHAPEFVVVDLDTGRTTTTKGPAGIYANSNYQVSEQLRAPNGRIFFPELANHVAYYDPDDEQVKQLGQVITTAEDKAIYRMVFGPDGKLYGGTQSNALPKIFSLDPVTLEHRLIGEVGAHRNGYSYAYYLAVDPPWIYVAVGQDPWELVALDTRTGASRVLATRGADGFMQFEETQNGVVAKLISGLRTKAQQTELVRCIDGRIEPMKPGTPMSRARSELARRAATLKLPELELSKLQLDGKGTGTIRWNPGGGNAWRETRFASRSAVGVAIESLIALPDGSLLGSAEQYHGFFRVDGKGTLTRYDSLKLSGGPRVVVDGRVYLSGYPNSPLYLYDPSAPWRPDDDQPNPRRLGSFTQAAAHYPYYLVPSKTTDRLFFAGRRERTGQGAAVGYYDLETNAFAGHHDRLEPDMPRGLAVLDELRQVVLSTTTRDGGELVVYDVDLREQARIRPVAGARSGGEVFSLRDVIVGISREDRLAYRYDLRARKLLGSIHLDGQINTIAQRADGSLWILVDRRLIRLDPETLGMSELGVVSVEPTQRDLLVWQGDRLYWTTGAELRVITLP